MEAHARDEAVILVRLETSPDDIMGMEVSKGTMIEIPRAWLLGAGFVMQVKTSYRA